MNVLKKLLLLFIISIFGILNAQSSMRTVGPQGEKPVKFGTVGLTPSERELIIEKNLKVSILMHTESDFSTAVIQGVKDRLKLFNAEVSYIANADFNSEKQVADVEKSIELGVDLIIILVIDPVNVGKALKKAVSKGIKVSLLSNLPQGFKHGIDYASIVTDDLFTMGKYTAEMMGDYLGGKGNVVWLFHDAEYYVTNQRDNSFKYSLNAQYPDVKIVAEQGISNPADTKSIVLEILKSNPDVDAIYAPWDSLAEGVIEALKETKRASIKVFTMDLGTTVSVDMANNGYIQGIVADLPHTIGETLATVGCKHVLGGKTPAFVVVPAIKVGRNNLLSMWKRAYHVNAPKVVVDALK